MRFDDGLVRLYHFSELYPIEGYPSIQGQLMPEPQAHQKEVLDYLKHGGQKDAVGDKRVEDIFTGKLVCPWVQVYTDGTYMWDSQVIYYVEKYNMKLPDEFVAHVLEKQVGSKNH